MNKRIKGIVLIIIFFSLNLKAQKTNFSSGEILLDLKKLNTIGSVLYLAAHPDDENTRMITYFANERCTRTAYLSLTRGDGGQNLIGSEKAEKMGLIRTQELLAARSKDGGQQFFTRAVDFGYSKHPDETLRIWNRDSVLADVVWVIRKFRPDVIITRFSPNSAGETHGHHTSSAVLGAEAFKLASDPKAFPEQLKYVDVWSPKRIFFNTSWWFYGNKDFDKTGLVTVDVGAFNKILGKNYGEIAGSSRSMHKSQGFGASEEMGSIEEYLDFLDGEKTVTDPLENVNLKWSGLKNGNKVQEHIDLALKEFNPEEPSLILGHLLNARKAILQIEDKFWKNIKLEQVDDLITSCLGFNALALSADYVYAPGDSLKFNLELINRSNKSVKVSSIALNQNGFKESGEGIKLPYNELSTTSYALKIPSKTNYSNPYWLESATETGLYNVSNKQLIGMPESPAILSLDLELNIEGTVISKSIPFYYRWVDRVRGELFRDLIIAPPVTANFLEQAMIFANSESKKVKMAFKANTAKAQSKITFDLPEGWTANPASLDLSFNLKGEQLIREITITPSAKSENGSIKANVTAGGSTYSKSHVEIAYDHIPYIDYFPISQMPVVKIDLKRKGELIGYINGAGDDVPEALMQMGYKVEFLDENKLIQESLEKYDAIISGIRAYNTENWISENHSKLMSYVENGGNLIIQYNTNRGLNFDLMGPYKFELGRDRVTVEEAEIRILDKESPILNIPNKLSEKDFDNWVQERGLYFASSWSEEFSAPLETNDPGEEAKKGMLITAQYGKGYFTYTGISFFRQLPAGVPGAYRLIANIISLGN